MANLLSLLAGAVFAVGLIVSGMSDPAKVLAFLDLAGRWDPSLALVMLGAIGVAMLPYRFAMRRRRTLLDTPVHLPPPAPPDRRVLAGAAVFGVGWGLAGYCPGPVLVGLGAGNPAAALFVVGMLAGMAAHARWGGAGKTSD
ncbi:MAG: YeeE/YedE family protein [Rhodocyclaceae bacterium]|nr:YeeE/YedE family protein [Rhodocyclaceae bacterium]